MIALGLLLLIAGVGFATDVAVESSATVNLTMFGHNISAVPLHMVVWAAGVAGIVAVAGLAFLLGGARRLRALRRDRRTLRKVTNAQAAEPTTGLAPGPQPSVGARSAATSRTQQPSAQAL